MDKFHSLLEGSLTRRKLSSCRLLFLVTLTLIAVLVIPSLDGIRVLYNLHFGFLYSWVLLRLQDSAQIEIFKAGALLAHMHDRCWETVITQPRGNKREGM